MGVSRLTGMNSDAINAKTHSAMANTPLQWLCWPRLAGAIAGDAAGSGRLSSWGVRVDGAWVMPQIMVTTCARH